MIRVLRRLRWKPVWACLLALLTIAPINLWITRSAKSRTFNRLDQLPANDVDLVLGSSARVRGGFPNPHFQNRVEAAAKLYHASKVNHLLLSGDNHTASYDESTDLQDALLKLGVPRSSMTLDYAGFRTLDSIVRAKTVFGLSRLTIITDDFHLQRALFISQSYGVDAVAFCSNRRTALHSTPPFRRRSCTSYHTNQNIVKIPRQPGETPNMGDASLTRLLAPESTYSILAHTSQAPDSPNAQERGKVQDCAPSLARRCADGIDRREDGEIEVFAPAGKGAVGDGEPPLTGEDLINY